MAHCERGSHILVRYWDTAQAGRAVIEAAKAGAFSSSMILDVVRAYEEPELLLRYRLVAPAAMRRSGSPAACGPGVVGDRPRPPGIVNGSAAKP